MPQTTAIVKVHSIPVLCEDGRWRIHTRREDGSVQVESGSVASEHVAGALAALMNRAAERGRM